MTTPVNFALLTAGLLALSGAPARAATLADPAVTTPTPQGPVTELTLKNGLHVILVERHASPVVTFDVTYRVGARNERLGATGSAHLLEHMMFKGTKRFGKGQIAQLLGRNGASYNASTWPDYTNFYETYASDRLELGFEVEASRMRDALILDAERQPEMTVVRNEMEGDESDPANVLYSEVTELAFKAHPYHHPVIGYRSDVESVSTEHLRHFYDTYYQPNNAVAVLVGDFELRHAEALAHQYFDALPAGPPPPAVYTREEPQTGERRLVLRRRSETNLLQLAFHIPQASSTDIAPLLVLDALLTNGVTSRLSQALVENDRANRVWSEVGIQRDSSLFRIGAELKPAHDGTTDQKPVEEALWRSLDFMRTSFVPPLELEHARRQTLANYAYGIDGAESLALELGSFAVRDRWQRSFELQAQIAHVTASDLNRVIKAYLTRDNATTGWYLGTPDGPVPPAPVNLAGGRARGTSAGTKPLPLLAFEHKHPRGSAVALPTERHLPCGLDAWVLEVPTSRTVAIDGFVRAGSALDPPGKAGVAECVADLLDAGSTHHDKLEQARQLEDLGASLEFDTEPFATNMTGQCLPEDTPRVLDALAERLGEPLLSASELERLVDGWKTTLAQGEDDPATRARRGLLRSIFPTTHPLYQRTPSEAGHQLDALSAKDLQAFHREHYGPNATTLVVVGHVQAEEVFSELQTAFAAWKPVNLTPLPPTLVPSLPPQRVAIDMPDKTEVEIFVGEASHVARNDAGYFAYALANDILGGDTWSSRLGARLRDAMGLTYGVYSELDAQLIAGSWDATLSVNPANTESAIAALKQELLRFTQGGVTTTELAFAKRAFVGSQAHQLATNAGLAHAIAHIALYNLGVDYWARYPGLIDAVTLEDVNSAARAMVQPDALSLVTAGPPAKP